MHSKTTKRKNRLSQEIQAGVIYLGIGLFLVLTLTTALYLYNVTISSQMGYEFKQHEQEKFLLVRENEDLKLKVLKVSSYENISDSPLIKNMEPSSPEFYESREERLQKKVAEQSEATEVLNIKSL